MALSRQETARANSSVDSRKPSINHDDSEIASIGTNDAIANLPYTKIEARHNKLLSLTKKLHLSRRILHLRTCQSIMNNAKSPRTPSAENSASTPLGIVNAKLAKKPIPLGDLPVKPKGDDTIVALTKHAQRQDHLVNKMIEVAHKYAFITNSTHLAHKANTISQELNGLVEVFTRNNPELGDKRELACILASATVI